MHLTFFYDYSSPFAYLGSLGVEALAREHDAELHWHPFLLGALFKAIGTPMVPVAAMAPAKADLYKKDMLRWAAHREADFTFPSRFPMNTVKALRMTLQVEPSDVPRLSHALFRAYWSQDQDINDDAVLKGIADDLDLDGGALLAGTQNPEVKDRLRAHTDAAVAAGVPGAPSFLVRRSPDDSDGMLFWGQDRFELIGRALGGWRPDCG
ncbi:MAG: 2-hydroxychromene-2-carboxylate isomerase [Myxococcota bacterium]